MFTSHPAAQSARTGHLDTASASAPATRSGERNKVLELKLSRINSRCGYIELSKVVFSI